MKDLLKCHNLVLNGSKVSSSKSLAYLSERIQKDVEIQIPEFVFNHDILTLKDIIFLIEQKTKTGSAKGAMKDAILEKTTKDLKKGYF